MKKTIQQLEKSVTESISNHGLYTNSVWKHYKGELYKVLNLSVDCNTNELLVNYILENTSFSSETYLNSVIFTRNILEWFELIDDNPRFTRVKEYKVYMTKEEINKYNFKETNQ